MTTSVGPAGTRFVLIPIVVAVLWLLVAFNIGWSHAKATFATAFRAEVQRCADLPERKDDVQRCLDPSEKAVSSIQQNFLAGLPGTLALAFGPCALLGIGLAFLRRRSPGGTA